MEALFIFIVKSSGLLLLFYCAYYFLLRKETFFNSSRWFLLAGLITSVILPFLVYNKIVWVEPAPIHVPISKTISIFNYPQVSIPHNIENETFDINWNYVVLAIYGIGFLILIIKFAIDFYSLSSVLKGKKIQQQADFKFVDISENIAPFSYFDYIVYNSSMYTASELESIIEHEKVHSDQNHTMDVLISRVFCVLFWFNPIIWWYKKAILQNLEFIADSEAAKKISDKKAYQYTLLKITTHESCVAITNHFYQSLIKKRIVMLNKNQSKKSNYWKYYAILPALVAFVLLFQIKTIAQEKVRKETQEITEPNDSIDVFRIKKTTTDQELKVMAEKLKKYHDANVLISNVKRNSKNELTAIRVEIKKGNEETQTLQIDGDKAIKNCGIVVSTDDNGLKKIGILTDDEIDKPMAGQDRIVEVSEANNPDMIAPPTPPAVPSFPDGPIPAAPVTMLKMPKPPVAPANPKDKVAMAKFEKEVDEFDKKMVAFEPDMSAYEKKVEQIMTQREAIFDKEMEKYDIAMEKYDADMEKYSQNIEQQVSKNSKQHKINMKQYLKNMKTYEKNMKIHEEVMRQMEQHEQENKKT